MSLTANTQIVTPLAGARDVTVADSGGMYVASMPAASLGAGIAGNASGVATFVETTPYIILVNLGLKTIYPVHLRMHTVAVGTGNTTGAQNWTFTIDPVNRYTSGGTALVPVNTNMTSPNQSGAEIYVGGTLVATAASPLRVIVGHQATKYGHIEIVHDCLQFNFGGAEQCDPCSFINNTSTNSHYTVNFAPVAIGPGHSFIAYRWVASNSALPTYEVEMAYFEK